MKSQHVTIKIRVLKAEEDEMNKIFLQVMQHLYVVFEGYFLTLSNINIVLCYLFDASGKHTHETQQFVTHIFILKQATDL